MNPNQFKFIQEFPQYGDILNGSSFKDYKKRLAALKKKITEQEYKYVSGFSFEFVIGGLLHFYGGMPEFGVLDYPVCEAKTPGIHAGGETSLTRNTSCEILNIWARKPSVQKVVKRTAGQAGVVCGANIRRDVKISHSAVKQKDRDVSSGITVLQGGEDVNTKNWERICLETGATVFTAVSEKNNFCVNGSRPNGQGDARERFISEFKKTKSDCILAHIDTMGEGIDVPGITGCILFGAGDVVRIIQNIGRAMRVLASDRELKKSDRIKKVALLGMVSYNGETSGQEFLSSIARAMREMSSDDFYKKFLSFQFNNRGASKSQPDDVGGGTGNYLAEHQMDLAGFDTTIEDDTPLFDDGDCPPDEIIALDLMMVEQGEQERRQQEQEEQDMKLRAIADDLMDFMNED